MSGENRILGRVPVKMNPRIHRVVVASADGSRFGLYEEDNGHLLRWLVQDMPFLNAMDLATHVAAGSQHAVTHPRTGLVLATCVMALTCMGEEGGVSGLDPQIVINLGEAA
jgi:hypothetical protein